MPETKQPTTARKTTPSTGKTVAKAPEPIAKVEPASAPVVAAAKPAEPVKAAPAIPATTETKPAAARAPAAKKATTAAKPKAAAKKAKSALPDQGAIDHMIQEAAYYLAEKRNFAPGYEEEDWLAAQAEILAKVKNAEF
jgi:hypothetical protein